MLADLGTVACSGLTAKLVLGGKSATKQESFFAFLDFSIPPFFCPSTIRSLAADSYSALMAAPAIAALYWRGAKYKVSPRDETP